MNSSPQPTPPPSAQEILAEAQRRIAERENGGHAGGQSTPDATSNDKPKTPQDLEAQERHLRRTNRAVFWLSKHWLQLFNGFMLVFTALAFLAPALMHSGHTESGMFIHRLYDPFCHQFPFRSWFLFGPQAAYRTDGMLAPTEMLESSKFLGSAELGFKTAMCQRCIAIYGAMALAGILYGLLRRRFALKPLPIWAFVLFGIAPMGLDGGIQWLTYIIHWLVPSVQITPLETTPFMRTLTGGLFGALSAALLYPHMQVFFDETYQTLSERYGWR